MTICYLDMDGVIASFVDGVYEVFSVKEDPYQKAENWGNWYVQDILGIPSETFYGRLGYDFWASLPKTKEADEIVQCVVDTFGAKNVRICTTPITQGGCYSGKFDWILRHYPFLRRSLVTTKRKYELARPDRVLVDDSDVNIDEFNAAGGKTFLYPRPWNRRHAQSEFGLSLFQSAMKGLTCLSSPQITSSDCFSPT